jgi:Protein of unknown function (DUF3309)
MDGHEMTLALWLVPLLLAAAAFPRWRHSRQWGYVPSVGLLLLGLLVLAMHLHDMI